MRWGFCMSALVRTRTHQNAHPQHNKVAVYATAPRATADAVTQGDSAVAEAMKHNALSPALSHQRPWALSIFPNSFHKSEGHATESPVVIQPHEGGCTLFTVDINIDKPIGFCTPTSRPYPVKFKQMQVKL